MDNKKFTKGKWEVKHSESKPAFNVVGTQLGGKYKIARCPYMQDKTFSKEYNNKEIDEAQANAKLIASAPEMLEMLIEFSTDSDGYDLDYLVDKAKELILKITD